MPQTKPQDPPKTYFPHIRRALGDAATDMKDSDLARDFATRFYRRANKPLPKDPRALLNEMVAYDDSLGRARGWIHPDVPAAPSDSISATHPPGATTTPGQPDIVRQALPEPGQIPTQGFDSSRVAPPAHVVDPQSTKTPDTNPTLLARREREKLLRQVASDPIPSGPDRPYEHVPDDQLQALAERVDEHSLPDLRVEQEMIYRMPAVRKWLTYNPVGSYVSATGRGLYDFASQGLQAAGMGAEIGGVAQGRAYVDPTQQPLYRAGERMQEKADDILPYPDDPTLGQEIAHGVGQGIGFMATGVAGPAVGLGSKMAPMLAGAAVNGISAYREALQQGATPEDAFESFTLNAVVGLSEGVPIGNALGRLNRMTGNRFAQVLKIALAEGGEEAIQETFQTIAGMAIEGLVEGEDNWEPAIAKMIDNAHAAIGKPGAEMTATDALRAIAQSPAIHAAKVGAGAGMILGGGGGVVQTAVDRRGVDIEGHMADLEARANQPTGPDDANVIDETEGTAPVPTPENAAYDAGAEPAPVAKRLPAHEAPTPGGTATSGGAADSSDQRVLDAREVGRGPDVGDDTGQERIDAGDTDTSSEPDVRGLGGDAVNLSRQERAEAIRQHISDEIGKQRVNTTILDPGALPTAKTLPDGSETTDAAKFTSAELLDARSRYQDTLDNLGVHINQGRVTTDMVHSYVYHQLGIERIEDELTRRRRPVEDAAGAPTDEKGRPMHPLSPDPIVPGLDDTWKSDPGAIPGEPSFWKEQGGYTASIVEMDRNGYAEYVGAITDKEGNTVRGPYTSTVPNEVADNLENNLATLEPAPSESEVTALEPVSEQQKPSEAIEQPKEGRHKLPNYVYIEVRDNDGNVMGVVGRPYDGSKAGAAQANDILRRQELDKASHYAGWSNVNSRTATTDAKGNPKFAVSANSKHVAPAGSEEAAFIGHGPATEGEPDQAAAAKRYGEEQRAKEEYAKTDAGRTDSAVKWASEQLERTGTALGWTIPNDTISIGKFVGEMLGLGMQRDPNPREGIEIALVGDARTGKTRGAQNPDAILEIRYPTNDGKRYWDLTYRKNPKPSGKPVTPQVNEGVSAPTIETDWRKDLFSTRAWALTQGVSQYDVGGDVWNDHAKLITAVEDAEINNADETWHSNLTQAGRRQVARLAGLNRDTAERLMKMNWHYIDRNTQLALIPKIGMFLEAQTEAEKGPELAAKPKVEIVPTREGIKTRPAPEPAAGKHPKSGVKTPQKSPKKGETKESIPERGKISPEKGKPAFGESNTIFTKEDRDQARKDLLDEFGLGSNPVFNAKAQLAGLKIVGYYVEGGARSFAAVVKELNTYLGEHAERFRHFYAYWYNSVRDFPGFPNEGMDSRESVEFQAQALLERGELEEAEAVPEDTGVADLDSDIVRNWAGQLPTVDLYDVPIPGDGEPSRLYTYWWDGAGTQHQMPHRRPGDVELAWMSGHHMGKGNNAVVIYNDPTNGPTVVMLPKVRYPWMEPRIRTQAQPISDDEQAELKQFFRREDFTDYNTPPGMQQGGESQWDRGTDYVAEKLPGYRIDRFFGTQESTVLRRLMSMIQVAEGRIRREIGNGRYRNARGGFSGNARFWHGVRAEALDLLHAATQDQFRQSADPAAKPTATEDTKPKSEQGERGERSRKEIRLLVKLFDAHVIVPALEGAKVDWRFFKAEADKAFGGTQAEGAYTIREATDLLELAINARLTRSAVGADAGTQQALARIDELIALQNKMPTQTRRDQEQIEMQQFSTPPAYAYLAAWLANINNEDVGLEPSAGTGGLAAWIVNLGGEAFLNELSDRRRALLEAVYGEGGYARTIYGEDAEHLSKIKPGMKPTVVVMNPPFSRAGHRAGNKMIPLTGAKHIEEAMRSLQPGGRLVAIVGRGMSFDSPTFRAWWHKMQNVYDVRANVPISGDVYKKYGTHFGTRILVIDKVEPTPGQPPIVADEEQQLKDVVKLLEGIRYDRPEITKAPDSSRESAPDQPSGLGISEQAPSGSRPRTPIQPTVPPVRSGSPGEVQGTGVQEGSDRPGSRPGAEHGSNEGPQVDDAGSGARSPKAERPKRTSEPTRGRVASDADRAKRAPVAESDAKVEQVEKTTKKELSSDIFEHYEPTVTDPRAQEHPSPLVESAAMAAVQAPEVDYVPNLPEKVIIPAPTTKDGRRKYKTLSKAQIETVIRAGAAFLKRLESGLRQGFFIGDGTGVGKGMQIAAIIMDHYRKGYGKAIWISERGELLAQAKRDWVDVGGKKAEVFNLTNASKHEDGIAFSTYATLRGAPEDTVYRTKDGWTVWVKPNDEVQRREDPNGEWFDELQAQLNLDGKRDRLREIVEWLGEDFDGVLVFDEAHNMSNAMETVGGMGAKKASKQATRGIRLQQLLPHARVLYSTATGATEVNNLGYLERLPLWGPGTDFENKAAFVNSIEGAGLATMEMVAQNLKALGVYTARSLSWEGVEHAMLTHDLTPDQQEMWTTLAEAWSEVFRDLEAAIETVAGGSSEKGISDLKKRILNSQFWSAQLRFFEQTLLSLQVPTMLADIEKQLEAGNAAVVQLINTFEAATVRELERLRREGASLDDFDISPKEQLFQMVDRIFPTAQVEEITTLQPDGTRKTELQPVTDSDGNPVENPEAVAAKKALLTKINMLKMPESPMDAIIARFGPDQVAEVSGRKERVFFDRTEGRNVHQKLPGNFKKTELARFQNDEARILIFSGAGATGLDAHASLLIKNQRRRFHYVAQAGWRAMTAMQGMGRTHRSFQRVPPFYQLVTTNLNAHKRFVSTIARRLDQLGALTRGSRQAGSAGLMSSDMNLETEIAQDSLTALLIDMHENRVPMDLETFQNITKLNVMDSEKRKPTSRSTPRVKQFMNRMLALPIDQMNSIWDAWIAIIDMETQMAREAGRLDEGMSDLPGKNMTLAESHTVYSDKETGATAELKTFKGQVPQHKTPWDMIVNNQYINGSSGNLTNIPEHQHIPDNKTRFVRNTRSGKVYAIFRAPATQNQYGQIQANVALISPAGVRRTSDIHKILQGDTWNDFTKNVLGKENWEVVPTDDAQAMWDEQLSKIADEKDAEYNVVTGTILQVWSRFVDSTNPRVVRVLTDDGVSHVGRLISDKHLAKTKANMLAGQQTREQFGSAADVLNKIIRDDARVYLANGARLFRSNVSGDQRVELVTREGGVPRALTVYNAVFSEDINYKRRFFVPTGSTQGLHTILDWSPIARIQEEEVGGHDIDFDDSGYMGAPRSAPPGGSIAAQVPNVSANALYRGRPVNVTTVIQAIANITRAAGRYVPLRIGGTRSLAGIFKIRAEVSRIRNANSIGNAAHETAHALEKVIFGWGQTPWRQANVPAAERKRLKREAIRRVLQHHNRTLSDYRSNQPLRAHLQNDVEEEYDALVRKWAKDNNEWPGIPRQAQRELTMLGELAYPNTPPHGGYVREGFAEFFAMYITGMDTATQAPHFHTWFEFEWLADLPKVSAAIAHARNLHRVWSDQGGTKRAESTIERGGLMQKLKPWLTAEGRDRAKTKVSKEALTEYSPLLRLVELAEQTTGRPVSTDKNPYKAAQALGKIGNARVWVMVNDAMVNYYGTRLGPSLKQILDRVKDRRTDFTTYLYARRALKLWRTPTERFPEGRNPGISEADAETAFNELDNPTFQAVALELYEWSDHLLDYLVPMFGQELVDRIKDGDVGDYIPLQRVFDDMDDMMRAYYTGKGSIKGGDPIKALRGSGRRVRDPLQTLIEKAEAIVNAAHRREVINMIVELARLPGMGSLIEEVDKPLQVHRLSAERVRKQLEKEGYDVDDTNADIDAWLTFFTRDNHPRQGGEPVVAFYEGDGVVKHYRVNRELYNTLEALEPWYGHPLLYMTVGLHARMFRLGTTGIRASFQLVTNLLRDPQTAFMQTVTETNPLVAAYTWLNMLRSGFLSAVAGKAEMKGIDPWYTTALRLGLPMATYVGQDSRPVRRAVRKIFENKVVRFVDPRNWAEWARDVLQFPELATRVAEGKMLMNERGIDDPSSHQLTREEMFDMLIAMKQVTVDFTDYGRQVKMYNQYTPFFGASISGARSFLRAWKRNPARVISKGFPLAMLTLMYWWDRKDEEWYNEIPLQYRFLYWFHPVGNEVVVIPRAFEWGGFFSSIPEAIAHSLYQKDPEYVREVAKQFAETTLPMSIPDENKTYREALTEMAPKTFQMFGEQLGNKEIFFDRPIVPRAEQDLPKEEQFGPYTTMTARRLGEIFNSSPRRIEHRIRSLSGPVGMDAIEAYEGLLVAVGMMKEGDSVVREREAADLPVVGRLFKRGGKMGYQSRTVDKFYTAYGEYLTAQGSRKTPETDLNRQKRLAFADAAAGLKGLRTILNNTPGRAERAQVQQLMIDVASSAIRIGQVARTPADVKRLRDLAAGDPRAFRRAADRMQRIHIQKAGATSAKELIERLDKGTQRRHEILDQLAARDSTR